MFNMIQMIQMQQRYEAMAEGLTAASECWIRNVVRGGSKAGRAWYRSSFFAFRRVNATTYQVRTLRNESNIVTVRGNSPADLYAAITHTIEQLIA